MKDFSSPLFEAVQVYLDRTPRDGPAQMALDEAILERAAWPVLRVYCWSEDAVSFGYSQSYREVVNMFPHRPLVRRWTGGGMVEHGADWTFSLMVPMDQPAARLRPAEAYERIHDAVMAVLAHGGARSRLAVCEDRISGAACFVAPALHDVLGEDGKKLCGGAQRRTRHGFLHQGSIQGVTIPENFVETLARHLAGQQDVFPFTGEIKARTQALITQKYDTVSWREKIP
jgi:lipoyl(octanoyl) transferase